MTIKNLAEIKPEEANASTYGGKAANLSKMIRMGLPVPPGFVSPTNMTEEIGQKNSDLDSFALRLDSAIRGIVSPENGFWGKAEGKPLVVSVRSGAPISMPGMMDTILNVGLTEHNLEAFAKAYDSRRFALDCYRRLIQMYGDTVKGIEGSKFSSLFNDYRIFFYDGMTEAAYEDLIATYLNVYKKETGEDFPNDPKIQLLEASRSVYRSWYSDKAVQYREIEGIPHDLGTAVTVQKMVFGNLDNSATGVVFTHNPNTGEMGLYGDFLEGAQGEDVVSGAFRVKPISAMMNGDFKYLGRQLQAHLRDLYAAERDIIDVEFTIEQGKLYVLQYRKAKRSTKASVRFIIDLVKRNEVTSIEASKRFFDLMPKKEVTLDDHQNLEFAGKGIGVTSEVAVGKAALTLEFVEECIKNGDPYIFIANETSPEDTPKMKEAAGILTAQGGTMSHAAVVARGWDKPCVVSATQLKIIGDKFTMSDAEHEQGDIVKIDGESGSIWM